MSLGFQHLYMELDDLDLLKKVIELYLTHEMGDRPRAQMIGVLIVKPGADPPVRLPWTLRGLPRPLFPLMLIDRAWLEHPDPAYKPWYNFDGEPTYVLKPAGGYGALDQFLHQLSHYLQLHDADWREAWLQVPRPDFDGSLDVGFTLSAGNFHGPLVIGRVWAEYHK